MPLPLIVQAELDRQAATQAANDAERLFEQTSRDIAEQWRTQIGRGTADAGQAIDRMADSARDAYRRMGTATADLLQQEQRLQDLRNSGADAQQIRIQSERVAQARRDETQATRDAARAHDQYTQSVRDATQASSQAGSSLTSGLRSAAGEAGSAGQDAAQGFFDGFAGSAAIMRIGAAGGPVGLALAAAAALGVGAGKLLADNVMLGLDSLREYDMFQVRTGATDKLTYDAGVAAGNAYTDGWGDSRASNLQAAQFAIQGGLIDRSATDGELQLGIENLQALAEVMNVDVQEAARAAGQLMRTDFAGSVNDAFDFLVAGSQRGLDMSDEWLDSIVEYSTQFRDIGLEGADVIGLLYQSVDAGAPSIDKAADAFKEFSLRAASGSKESAEGFAALGFNAEEMSNLFAQGGPVARQAFGEVLNALSLVENEQQQGMIWTALFGTQFEDMGRKAVKALDLSTARNTIEQYKGSMEGVKTTMSEHISQWDALDRNIGQTFTKLREWLAESWLGDFVSDTIPRVINDQIFGNGTPLPPPNRPPSADQATSMPGVPIDQATRPGPGPRDPGYQDWLAGVDAGQRARADLPPLPPGTAGPLPPPPPPPPGAPGAPLPAPPARGIPIPMVPDHLASSGAGGGGANDAPAPTFDPALWRVDLLPPTAMPGAPGGRGGGGDALAQFNADSKLLSAKNALEQQRLALLELEEKGNASQSQLLSAKNNVVEAERAYMAAQMDLAQAQQGTAEQLQSAASSASAAMGQIGATIDQDFGVSGGLPGIVENLVKTIGNLAAAPLLGQLQAISAANPIQGGHGAMGMMGAQNIAAGMTPLGFGALPGLYGLPGAPGGSFGGYGGTNVDLMLALAQASSGNVEYAAASDLVNGLADCSGSISDLYEILNTGQTTPGRSFTTTNFATDAGAAQLGFLPGFMPGALNVGVNPYPGQSGHMAATLPNGINFEGGGATGGGAQYGGPAAGALDPQFEKRYYLPIPFASRADGGFGTLPGDATIQRPAGRGLVQWAEDRTGGEAFIPLRGGQRSIDIWAQTGRFLGMFDQGGILEDGRPQIGGRPMGAGVGGGGFQGLGGVPMAAIQTAASSLDMLAPGAGQAAQTGIQLANRAIGYAGQLGGIGASALLETFSLNQSALADPSRSWIGRFATGFAGARPALPNAAGQAQPAAPAMSPQQVAANQGVHQGTGGAPGPTWTGDYHNHNATEDRAGADISRHLTAMYGARLGKR